MAAHLPPARIENGSGGLSGKDRRKEKDKSSWGADHRK